MRVLLLCGALVVPFSACSSASQSAQDQAPRRDRDLITAVEIAAAGGETLNAYQVVERLRPHWFNPIGHPSGVGGRGPAIVEKPMVFVNGMRQGEIGVLSNIQADHVLEIRYLEPRDAGLRYGTGYPAGIIQVVTRAGP